MRYFSNTVLYNSSQNNVIESSMSLLSQGLRQHLEEANAEAAKRADIVTQQLYNLKSSLNRMNKSGSSSDGSSNKSRTSSSSSSDDKIGSANGAAEKAPSNPFVTIETVQIDMSEECSTSSSPGSSDASGNDSSNDSDYAEIKSADIHRGAEKRSAGNKRKSCPGGSSGVGENTDVGNGGHKSRRMTSAHDAPESQDGPSGAKRPVNKLYFNPAFFEPENLAVRKT